jgi:hypothetical protein
MMSTVGSLALRVAICTLCLRLAAGNAAHSLHTVREGTLYERRAARGQSQTDPGPGAVESTIAADSSIQAEFESVYAAKKWGDYGGGSGLGSHPPNTVYAQRTILQVRLGAQALAPGIAVRPCLDPAPCTAAKHARGRAGGRLVPDRLDGRRALRRGGLAAGAAGGAWAPAPGVQARSRIAEACAAV